MQHSFALDGFLRADGMLFPTAFPFVPPAAHFSQQLESGQKSRLKPMVSKLPFLSRASFIIGRNGN